MTAQMGRNWHEFKYEFLQKTCVFLYVRNTTTSSKKIRKEVEYAGLLLMWHNLIVQHSYSSTIPNS
jgi:hypothetical protein